MKTVATIAVMTIFLCGCQVAKPGLASPDGQENRCVPGPWGSQSTYTLSWLDSWNGLICMVRVESVQPGKTKNAPSTVRLTVEKVYTANPVPGKLEVPDVQLRRPSNGPMEYSLLHPPMPAPGAEAILWMPRYPLPPRSNNGPSWFATIFDPIGPAFMAEEVVRPVEMIAAYRQAAPAGKAKAAEAILMDRKSLSVAYLCLDWACDLRFGPLGPNAAHIPTADEKRLLRAARDDVRLEPFARMLASRLLFVNDPAYKLAEGDTTTGPKDFPARLEHIAWVRAWFARPMKLDYWTWDRLQEDLWQYSARDQRGMRLEYETRIMPMLLALLESPDIDDVELSSILAHSLQISSVTSPQTNHRMISFILALAGKQSRPERTKVFLDKACFSLLDWTRNAVDCWTYGNIKPEDSLAVLYLHLAEYEASYRAALAGIKDDDIRMSLKYYADYVFPPRRPLLYGDIESKNGIRVNAYVSLPPNEWNTSPIHTLRQMLDKAGADLARAHGKLAIIHKNQSDGTTRPIRISLEAMAKDPRCDVQIAPDDVVEVDYDRDQRWANIRTRQSTQPDEAGKFDPVRFKQADLVVRVRGFGQSSQIDSHQKEAIDTTGVIEVFKQPDGWRTKAGDILTIWRDAEALGLPQDECTLYVKIENCTVPAKGYRQSYDYFRLLYLGGSAQTGVSHVGARYTQPAR